MSQKIAETKYTIEYVYLGEQVDIMGNISQLFRNKKGEFAKYSGVKPLFFGESYLISKKGMIKSRMPPQPKKQTLFVTDRDKMAYEANKEIAKNERLLRRKAMELKKPHQDIVKAIALLRPFVYELDSMNLHRFMKYLENQLSRKKKKK